MARTLILLCAAQDNLRTALWQSTNKVQGTTLFDAFDKEVFTMIQLATLIDSNDVSLLEHAKALAAVARGAPLTARLSQLDLENATFKDILGSVKGTDGFKAVNKNAGLIETLAQRTSECIDWTFGSSKMQKEAFLKSLENARGVYSGYVSKMLLALGEQLKRMTEELMAHVTNFTDGSSQEVANETKKAHAAVKEAVSDVTSFLRLLGIASTELPQVADAECALMQSGGKTVAWGLVQLLERPNVAHPTKGVDTRSKLKTLYEKHIKNQDERATFISENHLNALLDILGLKDDAGQVMADAAKSDGGAQTKDAAKDAEEDAEEAAENENPKKRQRSMG